MSNSYIEVVEQAVKLLDDISLKDYQTGIEPYFPSSIGAHIRHIVDHFLALMMGMPEGSINYNLRNRHNDVENQPQAAIEQLEKIIKWLSQICNNDALSKPLLVTTEIDINNTKSTKCASTLERELVFVTSHAIHHYALIKVIRNMQGKPLPQFFGYAPATISHINKSA